MTKTNLVTLVHINNDELELIGDEFPVPNFELWDITKLALVFGSPQQDIPLSSLIYTNWQQDGDLLKHTFYVEQVATNEESVPVKEVYNIFTESTTSVIRYHILVLLVSNSYPGRVCCSESH